MFEDSGVNEIKYCKIILTFPNGYFCLQSRPLPLTAMAISKAAS